MGLGRKNLGARIHQENGPGKSLNFGAEPTAHCGKREGVSHPSHGQQPRWGPLGPQDSSSSATRWRWPHILKATENLPEALGIISQNLWHRFRLKSQPLTLEYSIWHTVTEPDVQGDKPHEEELTETEDQQRLQIPATGITRYPLKITMLLCSKREKTVWKFLQIFKTIK